MKKLFIERGVEFKIPLLVFSLVLLTSCSTHRVILGEMEVWGNNEIKIDAPIKE